MNVTIEEAYEEACRALGESIVRERLIAKAIPQPVEDATASPTGE